MSEYDSTQPVAPGYPHDNDHTRGRLRHRIRQNSGVDAVSTATLPPTRETTFSTTSQYPSRRPTSSPPPPTPVEIPYPLNPSYADDPYARGQGYGPPPQAAQAEPPFRARNPWSDRQRTHSPPIDLNVQAQSGPLYVQLPSYPVTGPAGQPYAPYDSYSTGWQETSVPYTYPRYSSPAYGYEPPSTSPWPSSTRPHTYATPPYGIHATQPTPVSATPNWSTQGASSTTGVFGQEHLLNIVKTMLVSIPKEIYMLFLLRLPRFYFSRVTKVFEDAELSKPDIIRIYTTTAREWQERQTSSPHGQRPKRVDIARLPPLDWPAAGGPGSPDVTPAMAAFKDSWESFISSLLQEWNTLNIISALLSASILTLLSLDGTTDDPITRTAGIISLLCSLWSIVYASTYTVRFGPMRKMHKAASWAEEAQRRTMILWNVWALLAMPAVWLMWSLISFMVAVMSYVWRVNSVSDPDSRTTSTSVALGTRIAISCVLGLGLIYFLAMLETLSRYGERMDNEWKQTVARLPNQAWSQQKAGNQSGDPPFYNGSIMQHHQPPFPFAPTHYPPPQPIIIPEYEPRRSHRRHQRRSRSSSPGDYYRPSSPGRRRDGGSYTYSERPHTGQRRPSLRSPSRPPRRSDTGDGLSVRLQSSPYIINVAGSTSNLSLPRPRSQTSLRPQPEERNGPDGITLATISERTEPLSPPTGYSHPHSGHDQRLTTVSDGFDAFRAISFFDIDSGSIYRSPTQLHERGIPENLWQRFIEDVRGAWKTGFPFHQVHVNDSPSRVTPPEAVFHVCRVWSTGSWADYRVRPILCEEWLEIGLVSYAVYILHTGSAAPQDIRRAFLQLPPGVQKLVLLSEEPAWDADYRKSWTIQTAGSRLVVYDPEEQPDRGSEQRRIQLEHASSDASTTILGTGLSHSPQPLEREIQHATEQETARGPSPGARGEA